MHNSCRHNCYLAYRLLLRNISRKWTSRGLCNSAECIAAQEHLSELSDRVVAYVNVDSIVTGKMHKRPAASGHIGYMY